MLRRTPFGIVFVSSAKIIRDDNGNPKKKVLFKLNKTYLARRKELESLTFGSVDQRSIQLS